jgi:hypothetical protein
MQEKSEVRACSLVNLIVLCAERKYFITDRRLKGLTTTESKPRNFKDEQNKL